jgi:hypothetical protein
MGITFNVDTRANPSLCDTDPAGPFTILELGCATGGNSVALLKLVCSLGPSDRSILVIQNDLPDNAWSECFALVPLWSDSRCSHAVIGVSFYSSLLPPSSVDFVFSSTALHWGRVVVPFPILRVGHERLLVYACSRIEGLLQL